MRRCIALWGSAAMFVSAVASSADVAPTPELTLARHGERVTTRTLDELREVHAPVEVRVLEPYERREASFRAIRLSAVLDAVYSASWRSEEELLFTCRDGYQPGVPVQRLLRHTAWLAFERTDQPDFSIDKLESGARRRVALAPFYLIWENLEDEQVHADGDYGWPYQLVAIDLIRARDRFPKMVPPAGSSDRAQAGFRAFRMHCSRCHQVNGEGGAIGQELVTPVSPIDHRSSAWLRSWIDDPSEMVPTARMPRLNPELEKRQQTIDDILAYLTAMTRARDARAGDAGGR